MTLRGRFGVLLSLSFDCFVSEKSKFSQLHASLHTSPDSINTVHSLPNYPHVPSQKMSTTAEKTKDDKHRPKKFSRLKKFSYRPKKFSDRPKKFSYRPKK